MHKRPRGRPRKFKSRVQTNAEYCRTYRKRLKRSVHFHSDSHLWSTSQETFDEWNALYHFTVDVCALPENAKCERYYTPEQNGLQQDWSTEVAWCNPPYGRAISAWVQKAYEASKAGATVVCLLPSKTGPRWWQDYVKPHAAEIHYLPGRQKFSGKGSAPFDSAIVIFRPTTSVAEEDQRLFDRLRWGKWSADELQWVLQHLDPRTPTLVIEEIHAKLRELDLPRQPM